MAFTFRCDVRDYTYVHPALYLPAPVNQVSWIPSISHADRYIVTCLLRAGIPAHTTFMDKAARVISLPLPNEPLSASVNAEVGGRRAPGWDYLTGAGVKTLCMRC